MGSAGAFACAAYVALGGLAHAEPGFGFGEGQLNWTNPVTGHAHFGQGIAVSVRLGYVPTSSIHLGFLAAVDISYSNVTPRDWSWARAMIGPRLALPLTQHIHLSIDALFGLDYLPENAYAFELSLSPTYQYGHHMYVGGVLGVVYSHINEIAENYPDPNGSFVMAGASIGARW